MARIVGVDIPNDKQVVYSLQYIYGIGLTRAKEIVKNANVEPTKRVKDLSEAEITAIRNVIAKSDYKLEETNLNVKRLMEIGCYRGNRHKKGLPCRGQRTKTNARTCKGPRKTVANKKAATM